MSSVLVDVVSRQVQLKSQMTSGLLWILQVHTKEMGQSSDTKPKSVREIRVPRSQQSGELSVVLSW